MSDPLLMMALFYENYPTFDIGLLTGFYSVLAVGLECGSRDPLRKSLVGRCRSSTRTLFASRVMTAQVACLPSGPPATSYAGSARGDPLDGKTKRPAAGQGGEEGPMRAREHRQGSDLLSQGTSAHSSGLSAGVPFAIACPCFLGLGPARPPRYHDRGVGWRRGRVDGLKDPLFILVPLWSANGVQIGLEL